MGKHKKNEPEPKKDTPQDVARAMRREAIKSRGKEPTFRIYRGWKFGLSYGPIPVPTREVWEKLEQLPGGIEGIVKRFPGLKAPLKMMYDEFRTQLKAATEAVGDAAKILHDYEWILSASLHPRGRSSVEADWHFYGQMMAAIGAPANSLVTPIETTDPNAVHYNIWCEVPVEPPKVVN